MEAEVGGEQVLYLYGVVPSGQPLPASEAVPLETVPFADLVAVVEHVDASEFSAEALEQRLQSVDWVAPLARKHSAVLNDVMRHGPVVPARLCTLFSSADALIGSLAENEQRFRDALSLLKGREEWGLKVFCHEETLRSIVGSSDPQVKVLEAAATTASPGRAFVLRKKRDGCLAEVVSARIEEVLDEVLDTLASVAADTCLRPLLSEPATGRREAMVMNAALLVDVAAASALGTTTEELVSRFCTEGFVVELTGPWPPYSFCDDDDAARDGADESPSQEAR